MIQKISIYKKGKCKYNDWVVIKAAPKVVGRQGKVYAFDKDKDALRELEETVGKFNLKNIQLINGAGVRYLK